LTFVSSVRLHIVTLSSESANNSTIIISPKKHESKKECKKKPSLLQAMGVSFLPEQQSVTERSHAGRNPLAGSEERRVRFPP